MSRSTVDVLAVPFADGTLAQWWQSAKTPTIGQASWMGRESPTNNTMIATTDRRRYVGPDQEEGRMAGPVPQVNTSRSYSVPIAYVVFGIGLLGLAWPAIASPVSADERYQYLLTLARSDGTWSGIFTYTWQEIPSSLETGRIAYFAFMVQRLFYFGVASFSVMTGTSIVVGHAFVKLIMLALAVGSFRLFLTSLRQPGRFQRPLGRLSSVAVRRATLLFTVLLVCGVQMQVFTRSSWAAYPVLTWGAIAVMFGTTWLVLRLTAAVSCNRMALWYSIPAIVFVAVLLNTSYEMYYVAIPLALFALIVQGVVGDNARARWLPKVAIGGTLVGSFIGVFLIVRWFIARACAEQACYAGVEPNLGLGALRAGTMNLMSAVPLFGKTEAMEAVTTADPSAQLAGPFDGLGWMFASLVLVAMIWLYPRQGEEEGDQPFARTSERQIFLIVAVYGVAMAAGTSLIMGLSTLAQEEIIVGLGVPYRSTTVAWAGLMGALVAVTLIPLAKARRSRWAPLAVVSVVVLYAGIVVWPINSQITRAIAATPQFAIPGVVNQSVVSPLLTDEGNEARCILLDSFENDNGWPKRLADGSQRSFKILWSRAYCAESETSDDR